MLVESIILVHGAIDLTFVIGRNMGRNALWQNARGVYAALMVDVMIGATLMSPAMVRVLFLLRRQRAPGHDSGGIDR